MAFPKLQLALLVLLAAAVCCLAKEHDIGQWTTGPGQAEAYQKWAEKETFQTGDTIKFTYSNEKHNVVGLKTKEAFDSCDLSDPSRTFSDDNAIVPLAATGTKYYVCGFGSHCQNGMKVAINVVAADENQSGTGYGSAASTLSVSSVVLLSALFLGYMMY